MNSNKKTMGTKKDGKPALVPKRRFPEFRNDAEWITEALGQLANYENGKAYEQDITEIGKYVVVNSRFISTDGAVRKYTNAEYLVAEAGDVLMVLSDLPKGKALAKCYFVHANDRYAVNQRVCRLKPKQIDGKFLYYALNRHPRLLAFDDGLNQTHLSKGGVTECPLCIPRDKAEQHKIAECLNSVDEVITAQARKVDALKTHRKGLMQQLFPREGETQPRLRFPEFQNDGEWARMSIQEMIDREFIVGHLDGNHGELYPKAEEFSQDKEGIPYITANDFINGIVEFSRCKRLPIERARLFKKGVAKDGDILFAHNATVGPVAKLSTSEEFVILSTTATYYRCNAKHLSNDFLKSALSSPDFVAQYSRVMSQSTRNQVPITTQRKLELHVPKPSEQQRIASCLSSLDALITAETQKLEALKRHKRGLMQQLFPSPEEVAG